MFFLFVGARSGYIDHGHILPVTCPNCHKVTYWKLFELRSQVTLYAIPVSNSTHANVLCCDSCAFSIALNYDQVRNAHWLKQVTYAYFNKQITDEEYKKCLEQVNYLH